MTRILTLIVLALSASPALCEVINLTGQITGGNIFVPAVEDNRLSFFLVEDFPIDYTASVSIDSASQVTGFSFTATYATSPLTTTAPENLFPGLLHNDSNQLQIDFKKYGVFWTFLDLNLDKTTGTGEWEYTNTCAVCDGLYTDLSSVTATITSFSTVPEPHSALLAMVLASSVFAWRRSRGEVAA